MPDLPTARAPEPIRAPSGEQPEVVARLHPREWALIVKIRREISFGSLEIEVRDHVVWRVAKTTVYDDLSKGL